MKQFNIGKVCISPLFMTMIVLMLLVPTNFIIVPPDLLALVSP